MFRGGDDKDNIPKLQNQKFIVNTKKILVFLNSKKI